LSDFKQWWVFSTDFKESLKNLKYPSSGSRAGACGEHLMNLTSAFAKAHKKR